MGLERRIRHGAVELSGTLLDPFELQVWFLTRRRTRVQALRHGGEAGEADTEGEAVADAAQTIITAPPTARPAPRSLGGRSSGTAGCRHLVAEQARCDAQALGHRQIGRPGVGQHDLAGAIDGSVHAEHSAGLGVGYKLEGASGVPVDQCPGHVVEAERSAFTDVALLDRLGLGQPVRSELGLDEITAGRPV